MLNWLQSWYASNCDGDWEHTRRIRVNTLDNPGWHFSFNAEDMPLVTVPFVPVEIDRSETDWIRCRVEDGEFHGHGGPLNLEEILTHFRGWTETTPQEGERAT